MFSSSEQDSSSVGTMKADVDEKNFLNASHVYYRRANTDYWIQGESGNENWVTFSIPIGEVTDETRTVILLQNGWEPSLKWQVKINNNTNAAISGETTFNLSNKHNKIVGSFEFTLADGRKISGRYDIETLHKQPL